MQNAFPPSQYGMRVRLTNYGIIRTGTRLRLGNQNVSSSSISHQGVTAPPHLDSNPKKKENRDGRPLNSIKRILDIPFFNIILVGV